MRVHVNEAYDNKSNSALSRMRVLLKKIARKKALYILLIPGIFYFVLFDYVPMYGAIIAFKDFKPLDGILGSRWVGLQNFIDFFNHPSFSLVLSNTVIISFYKILFGFPAPIILALLLNEVKVSGFKRLVQTVTYLPHFLSWVVITGLVSSVLSPSTGIVNILLKSMNIKPIYFMADPKYFRAVLVITDIWKEVGWGSIIYLAAISGINQELYEAAIIDGAGRWKRTVYITLPSISSTIIIMLILRVGSIMNAGFEQIFMMYNASVYDVSDVIDTFVYRMGLERRRYSFATAVGLFKSIIGFTLIVITNKISKRIDEDSGIW